MRVQMSDSAMAVATVIMTAFATAPTLPRASLVYQDNWETDDLIRDLAAVSDRPDERFIEQHSSSLPAFTAEGLQWVLPQYLVYSLKHPQADATERIIFHLTPDDRESAYWRRRLEIFSPTQKSAICKYLEYMRGELARQRYDVYFARALSVWGCGEL
jgi:hypothetical protein